MPYSCIIADCISLENTVDHWEAHWGGVTAGCIGDAPYGLTMPNVWFVYICSYHSGASPGDDFTTDCPIHNTAAEQTNCGPGVRTTTIEEGGAMLSTDGSLYANVCPSAYDSETSTHRERCWVQANDHMCSAASTYEGQSCAPLPPPPSPSSPPPSPPPPPACGPGTVITNGACEVDCTSDRRLLEEDDADRTTNAAAVVSSYLEAHPELAAQMSDDLRRHIETMIEQHFGQPALA
jgi:hypothetical protein